VVITSNEVPDFKGNLSGLENKFAFFVFHRTGEIDLSLKSRMLETMPQIIRKAAKMYKEAVASDYAFDTEQGQRIAEQFLEGSSVVRTFVEEECVLGEGYQVGTMEMFAQFMAYAQQRRERTPSLSQFVQEIKTLYFGQIDSKRITRKKTSVLQGIRLFSHSDQQATPPTPQSRMAIDDPNPTPTLDIQSVSSQV